jgi:hypothetical protein
MPAADTGSVILTVVMNAAPTYALELRHNDEPLGRVRGAAVEVYEDIPHGEVRFWTGLRSLRIPLGRPFLPRPGRHLVTLIVR